ncbi:MAG: hypothetical protein GWN61_23330 [candidate division Zixibacteria bacterium]|nr:hypothetical protein [candidate division Zixibacteria bacterium]NIU16863.1 hypothetical protein [candidate division Zixibacteria bacterium]NIV09024.1 hypothetical protein [candidate division Zixibacteria bacterium]
MGLVTEKAGAPIPVKTVNKIGWHMNNMSFRSSSVSDNGKDLVPGKPFVRGYLKSVANGTAVAK